MWYVTVNPSLISKSRLIVLDKLAGMSFESTVEFCEGWNDSLSYSIRPHLRFEKMTDAMVYMLTFGGEMTSSPPAWNKE